MAIFRTARHRPIEDRSRSSGRLVPLLRSVPTRPQERPHSVERLSQDARRRPASGAHLGPEARRKPTSGLRGSPRPRAQSEREVFGKLEAREDEIEQFQRAAFEKT